MIGLDPREEERRRETIKLYIEFFRHFATVGSALAVLILALRKDLNLELELTLLGLVAMGATVLSSLWGVTMLTLVAARSKLTADPGVSASILVVSTALTFFLSILLLILASVR